MPPLGSAVATSDQRVSLRRSSNGKSNSVASICVVSSIETRSTKLKVSLRGRLSSTLIERCADQLGQLVEMGRREHRRHRLALRRMLRLVHRDEARPVIADRSVADVDAAERGIGGEDAVAGVDSMMSLYFTTDQYGSIRELVQ